MEEKKETIIKNKPIIVPKKTLSKKEQSIGDFLGGAIVGSIATFSILLVVDSMFSEK